LFLTLTFYSYYYTYA